MPLSFVPEVPSACTGDEVALSSIRMLGRGQPIDEI
jgi:hypothetical protein